MKKQVKYLGLIVLSIIAFLLLFKFVNNNKPFSEGDQKFTIRKYNLQQQGFKGLEEIFRAHTELSSILLIDTFDGDISKDGTLGNFNIVLSGYNNSKEYLQSYRFIYNSKKKILNYAGPKSNIKSTLPQIYNENNEISFLDTQLKMIPIKEQIEKLDFPSYSIGYNSNTKPLEGEPIVNINNNDKFPTFTFDEYKSGKYGKSNGHTSVIFSLYSGLSLALSENKIMYNCIPANSESLSGNKNNFMKKDYYINGYKIRITRDYGETWIDIPISEEDLSSTLEFYRLGIEIPPDSYYISDNPGGIIALLYGESPTLLLSKNDGNNWNNIKLDINLEKPITRRIIGFTDEINGYLALGTDWSMGSGEAKILCLTDDGGLTWNQKELPLSNTSSTLTGITFLDNTIGVLSLDAGMDEKFPKLFISNNKGDSWNELNLPLDKITEDVSYLSKVDSLTYENGMYKLVLGQDLNNNKKVVFESKDLSNDWIFKESYEAVIHYPG